MGRKKSEEWEYVTILKKLSKGMCTMKCKFYEHEWNGGPSRIRAHILGLKGFGVDKRKIPPKHVRDVVQRLHVGLQANTPGAEIDVEVADLGQLGETYAGVEFDVMGGVSSSVNVPVSSSKKRKPSGSQGSLSQSWNLQARKNANMAVRRFFYIPLFKVKSPYFLDMLRVVGEVGSNYKPPSYEQLRQKELLEKVRSVDKDLYGVRDKWKKYACTFACDGWSDTKRRPIINVMATSIHGSIFVKSAFFSKSEPWAKTKRWLTG
ncbi:hypothetical protein L7F22_057861 [Adiantum nelumboides]|nr:hypothetical protein [Adiantum nelumboides]